ncbi:MAG: hypothetical protein ACON5K_06075 [Bacteroidia bacterium]
MKRIIISFLLFFFTSSLFAQEESTDMDKFEELRDYRNELMKKELKLTDEESVDFFKLYNSYVKELRTERKKFRRKWFPKDIDNLGETEAKQYLKDAIALQQFEVDLLKKYSSDMAPKIGYSKVVLMKKAERTVNKKLVQRANELGIEKRRGR